MMRYFDGIVGPVGSSMNGLHEVAIFRPALRLALVPSLAMMGCNFGGKGDTSTPPIPSSGDSDTALEESCEGTPPEILSFSGTDNDMHDFETGAWPDLYLEVEVADADADLGQVKYSVWWDDTVDGWVDTDGDPDYDRYVTVNTTPCTSPAVTLQIHLAANGNPEPNTWYDLAVTVEDAAGLVSEAATTTAATPKDDGSEPDPQE